MEIRNKLKLKNLKPMAKKVMQEIGNLLFPPLNGVTEVFSTIYSSMKNIAFEDFLEGIGFEFENLKLEENDIDKLTKSLSNETNNQHIASILDSVFFSKNALCRNILGIIACKCLYKNELDYEDLIIINALKDLLDYDLDEFMDLYKIQPVKNNVGYSITFLAKYSDRQRIVVEKFQNLNVFGRDLALNRLGGSENPPLRYSITPVSERLNQYLEIFCE